MAAPLTRGILGPLVFSLIVTGFIRFGEAQTASNERIRGHGRVERKDVPGRRAGLSALKGAVLFAGSQVDPEKPVPLVIHFHGAPWLIEQHVSESLPRAALITVQLGAGSSVYGRPFADEKLFTNMLAEAERSLGTRRGWSSITLTGFSAGYGAIRAILRHPIHFEKVDNVLLLDGFHASYEPEGKAPSEVGAVSRRDIDSFVVFAREAARGRKRFAITHSQIHPGSYASTTECTSELLRELGVGRQMSAGSGPIGMRQLSTARKRSFRVFGYAGETAADHVDHLHAMPYWFPFLGVR